MNNLKKYRLKAGLTQKELSRKANISERAYQMYEHNERFPTIDTAKILAELLNSSLDEIWFTD